MTWCLQSGTTKRSHEFSVTGMVCQRRSCGCSVETRNSHKSGGNLSFRITGNTADEHVLFFATTFNWDLHSSDFLCVHDGA